MNTLKTFGRVCASGLFKLSILLFAIVVPIIVVFGSSSKLETTLQGSGIYSSAIDKALDSATKENNKSKDPNINNNDGGDSLPFDQPDVRAAVKQAVPPEQIQAWVEQGIDGTYTWLDGNATNPTIQLDFAATKQNLANSLGDYAVTRAKSLPVCTNAQLKALQASGGDVDPFKAACIPQGFDIASLRTKVQDQVLNNSDFLEKTTFTTADLPKNEQGKTVFEQAAIARTGYKLAKLTPYLWAGLALLGAGLLILLHDKKRRGAFVVSRTLVAIGVFVFVTAVVVRYLISQVSSPTGVLVKQVQGDFQSTIIFVVRSLGNNLNNVYITIGAVYVITGALGLLVLRLTRPASPAVASDDKEKAPETEASNEEEAKTDLEADEKEAVSSQETVEAKSEIDEPKEDSKTKA